MGSFTELALELQLEILEHLPPRDLAAFHRTSQHFYSTARRVLYRKTSGDFHASSRLTIENVRSMSEETASLVTTLVLGYHLDAMDAREMLHKCQNVEYLDVSEFSKRHEIAGRGSNELSPFEQRNPSEALEYLTTSCRTSFSRLRTVHINLVPGKVLRYFLGYLDSIENIKICHHYLPGYPVPGDMFEICSRAVGKTLKSMTLELHPFRHGLSDLKLLGSTEHFPQLSHVSWPLDFAYDWADFQEIIELLSSSHWRFRNTSIREFLLHSKSFQDYDKLPEKLAHYLPILDSFSPGLPTTIDINWTHGYAGAVDLGQRLQDVASIRAFTADKLGEFPHKRILYQCEDPPTVAAPGTCTALNGIAPAITSLELHVHDKRLSPAAAATDQAAREVMPKAQSRWTAWLEDFLPRCTRLAEFTTRSSNAIFDGFWPVQIELMNLGHVLGDLCRASKLRKFEFHLSSFPRNVKAKEGHEVFDPAGYEYGGSHPNTAQTKHAPRSQLSPGVAQLLFLTAGEMENLMHLTLRDLMIRTAADKTWLTNLIPPSLPRLESLRASGKYQYSQNTTAEHPADSIFYPEDEGYQQNVRTGVRAARLELRMPSEWRAKGNTACVMDLAEMAFLKDG